MKICYNCGRENSDQAKFCRFCGKNIEHQENIQPENVLPKANDSVQEKVKPIQNSGNQSHYALLACLMIGIALAVFVFLKFKPESSNQNTINSTQPAASSDVVEQPTETTIPAEKQEEPIKTKYDVANEVALAAKNFYLSYLDASNHKDKYLMSNCTEKLREERGEYMKVNEEYEFYNRKFIFDLGSLEYITEDGKEKAIFKVRTENDGYRYNDSSYVDNIRCLHIEAIKEGDEWLMDFVNKIDPSLLSENVFEVE